MEVVPKKIIMTTSNDNSEYHIDNEEEDHDQDVALPGFRFHPTDEELVGFYLKRKVNKKPVSIEIIKQIDIYKYDPWDLPSNAGDKEWYYFCIRGRKYRNSIRPNRVTGSGFWKATGIDKPIHSNTDDCIGLKKSLVYYRGSAGKGTKTDWMMHEFRLPLANPSSTQDNNANNVALEAEVWTLCRIFKRMTSHKKYSNMIPTDHCQSSLEITTPKKSSSSILSSLSTATHLDDSSSKTCSLETEYNNTTDHLYHVSLELNSHQHHHHIDHPQEALLSQRNKRSKAVDDRDRDCETSSESWFNLGQDNNSTIIMNSNVPQLGLPQIQVPVLHGPHYPSFTSPNPNPEDHGFLANGSWDELTSVVQSAVDRNTSELHDIIDKLHP